MSERHLGTSPLDPAMLRLRRRFREGAPDRVALIGRTFRVRVFCDNPRARRGFCLEVARASSWLLTGTAEGFVLPRGGVTPRCHSSVEPVALPGRRGERKSFWGASTNVARPSRPQRRGPRQRPTPLRPRKCVWRRLELRAQADAMFVNSSDAKSSKRSLVRPPEATRCDEEKSQESSGIRVRALDEGGNKCVRPTASVLRDGK